MAEAPRRVQVGRILKAHGVRGEVVVAATGSDPERLRPGLEVFLAVEGTDSLRVEASRWIERGWLVRFEGHVDRGAVEELAGLSLYLETGRLPALPEGEFYQFEIEGLAVRTAGGELLGRVEHVLDLPGGDVYEVQGPAGVWLIPGRREFIECVDLERGELRLTDRGDLLEAQRLPPGRSGQVPPGAAGPDLAGATGTDRRGRSEAESAGPAEAAGEAGSAGPTEPAQSEDGGTGGGRPPRPRPRRRKRPRRPDSRKEPRKDHRTGPARRPPDRSSGSAS